MNLVHDPIVKAAAGGGGGGGGVFGWGMGIKYFQSGRSVCPMIICSPPFSFQ